MYIPLYMQGFFAPVAAAADLRSGLTAAQKPNHRGPKEKHAACKAQPQADKKARAHRASYQS